MLLTAEQIADACGGDLVVDGTDYDASCAITWDSREVLPGFTYVCLPGEKVDGHFFIPAALRDGALVIIAMYDVDEKQIEAAGAALVRVPDTRVAFTKLGAAWRTHLQGKVLALTGSSGKTTTKNLVHQVLAAGVSVTATEGNQNNELGVPNTLLRAAEDDDAVVVEMGMRGLGQLEQLCTFVKPDRALVTNVGESHIELLGSRENIAIAKAEPFCALPDCSGIAYLNASDDFTAFIIDHATLRQRDVKVVLYDGSGAEPETYREDLRPSVYADKVELDNAGCASFTLCTPAGSVPCHLQIGGMHNVHNACAAAAVALDFGIDLSVIAQALQGAQAAAGRQHVFTTKNGLTVVDDAYNANPDSMRASLQSFSLMKGFGKHVAVLGDMGELGAFAQEGHERIGVQVASSNIDLLVCIGPLSRHIAAAACAAGMPEENITRVDTIDAVLDYLRSVLNPADAVLVKASHSMQLEKVVEGLVNLHV